MKISELRQKTENDLNDIIDKDRERLRQLRFDLASGKVKNVREIRKMRKEIARVLTLIKEGFSKKQK